MTRMIYTLHAHVELTVCRPDGTVEIIRNDKIGRINDGVFAKIVATTKAAGRGNVLSYINVTCEHVETDAEYAERLAGEAKDSAMRKPVWQTNASYGFASEGDECATHGSHRNPNYKED